MSFENINHGGTQIAENDPDIVSLEKERAARVQKAKAILQRKLIISSIKPGVDLGEHVNVWIENNARAFREWFNPKVENDLGLVEKVEGLDENDDEGWREMLEYIHKEVPTLF